MVAEKAQEMVETTAVEATPAPAPQMNIQPVEEPQLSMVASIGLPTVGQKYLDHDALALNGLATPVSSPVTNNVTSADGSQTVTGGAMQFNYTGSSNPHFVIYRMSAARNAYTDFFKSIIDNNGVPTISVNESKQSGSN